MTQDLLLALTAFAFVSSITPGPNNLMLMASGTNFGFVRTLPHMLGVGLGFTGMNFLLGLGVVQILNAIPGSILALKIGSTIYLLYLAWKIANAAPPAGADADAPKGEPLTFLQAVLFQWVNPKAWTMALTAIGAYTLPENPLVSLLIVTGVFGAINLPCVSSWTVLGTQLRRLLNDPVRLRIFNVTAAALLVASLYPILTSTIGPH